LTDRACKITTEGTEINSNAKSDSEDIAGLVAQCPSVSAVVRNSGTIAHAAALLT
jgi:hypothetical protein